MKIEALYIDFPLSVYASYWKEIRLNHLNPALSERSTFVALQVSSCTRPMWPSAAWRSMAHHRVSLHLREAESFFGPEVGPKSVESACEEAEEKFREVAEAYEVLSNAERRRWKS